MKSETLPLFFAILVEFIAFNVWFGWLLRDFPNLQLILIFWIVSLFIGMILLHRYDGEENCVSPALAFLSVGFNSSLSYQYLFYARATILIFLCCFLSLAGIMIYLLVNNS